VQAAPVPLPSLPALIGQRQIGWNEARRYTVNSNVDSLTFSLPAPMYVLFEASASVSLVSGAVPTEFQTGLYGMDSTNSMWTMSYRRGTFLATGQSVTIHTNILIKLPGGPSTVYWKLWLPGNVTVQLASGTLTATAVPATLGGEVAAVPTPEAERGLTVTQAGGESVTVDDDPVG
jgi:hypothetical protein